MTSKTNELHPVMVEVLKGIIPSPITVKEVEKWDYEVSKDKSTRYDFFERLSEDLNRAFQTTESKEAAHIFFMAEITCKEEMQRIFPAVDESETLPEV